MSHASNVSNGPRPTNCDQSSANTTAPMMNSQTIAAPYSNHTGVVSMRIASTTMCSA